MIFNRICTFFICFCVHLVSANDSLESKGNQTAEAYGHFFWSEMKSDTTSAPLPLESVIKGMRKAQAGEPCPVSSKALHQCLMQYEDDHYNDKVSKNLVRAEQFLDQLKLNPNIQILVPERLYMQILSAGSADVKQDDKPFYFNIKCELLSGEELVNTFSTGIPVTQDLNTAIRGFKEGIAGMKVGEKRRLYIHPDYGYGALCHIEPNSLLIVDVELLSDSGQHSKPENHLTIE